jgi:hypothetical protein
MWKEKLGNYLIDVSKYIITGVVITSLFKDLSSRIAIYVGCFLFSLLALIVGLILVNSFNKNGRK